MGGFPAAFLPLGRRMEGDDDVASAAVKRSAQGTGHNGREIFFEGINLFEVNKKGQIRRILAYWDPAAMMENLHASS